MAAAPELLALRSDLLAALERVDRLLDAAKPEEQRREADIIDLERTKAIEWVLARSGHVMRPIEIWAELRRLGRTDPKMEVQVTTFDLWKRGRVGKVGRGRYVREKT